MRYTESACIELKKGDYEIVKKFFAYKKYRVPAMAVLNGDFPGKVFVDNIDNPEIVLVWALSRWSYISCREISNKHQEFIKEIIINKVSPILNKVGENNFEIYADKNEKWDSFLEGALNKYEIRKHYENTFTFNMDKYERFKQSLTQLKEIKVNDKAYPIIPKQYIRFVLDEKLKCVNGVILSDNGKIISQCVNNGFKLENEYFIDIDTLDVRDRNKGYGTLAACELINRELLRGNIPLWETTVNNKASQKVAEKLGFEKKEEYPVYVVDLH